MRIARVRASVVSIPLERTYWMSLEPYRTASALVVEIEANDGLTGIGEAHGRPLEQIATIVTEVFGRDLIGRDPGDHERIWEDFFAYAHSRKGAHLAESHGQPHFGAGVRPQLVAALAGVDIALWDLNAKAAGVPLYRLLGGVEPRVPAYASGGYYGEDGGAAVDGLVAEMRGYVDLGYGAVKMKVGGQPLATDVERVRAVREAVGDDVDVMLDANTAYDIGEAIGAARAFEPFAPRWLEEPLRWYDTVFGTGELARSTSIPIASGESELHRWGCRDLIEHGGVRVMQFDATRAGGVTEWLRVAEHARRHDVLMAPHHDPHIHGQLVAAVPNGHVLEAFPDRRRDPLWHQLYTDLPPIERGIWTCPERPGLGVELDRAILRRYSVHTAVAA